MVKSNSEKRKGPEPVVQLVFDSLHYANTLKEAGVKSDIAEAQAKLQAETMSHFLEGNLATHLDIVDVRQDAANTNERLGSLEVKVEALEVKVEALEVEVKALRQDIYALEARLTSKIHAAFVLNVTVLGGLMTVFHFLH